MHRTYPTDLLHLPKKYGGHGIPNLYLLHIAKRLKLLFSSVHRQSECGRNLIILLETQQLEAGIRTSILKLHNAKVKRYLSETWLTHLLASIHDLGFSVKYDHWIPSQSQETIMDMVLHFNLPVNSLIIFNKVRISFQLLYCSDAYTLTGRHILPLADTNLIPRQSHLHWPERKVSPAEITMFFQIFRSIFPKTIYPTIRSSQPALTILQSMSSDNRPIRLLNRLSVETSQIYQVDAISNGSSISVLDLNTSTPFLPSKKSTKISMTTSQKRLAESVLDGHVQCGSDGSARHHSMSSATWFGKALEPTIIARPVNGPTIDSYRTEMDGVLHFLETLHPVQHCIPKTNFSFTLDNTPVVKFSNSCEFEVTAANIDQPYAPQKLAIRNYLRESVHTFDFSYVKSHQDDVKEAEELSIEEKNNVLCDAEAKIVSRQYASQELPSTLPYGLEISLESSQGLILEKIYAHLSSSVYFDYIQRNLSLTPHHLWQIDWHLHEMILKIIRKKDEILTRRIIWRKHYTMLDKFIQGNSETPRCPLCECDDDKFHFLRCRYIKASKEAQQSFYQLKQAIVKLNISPIMWHIICSHLEDLAPPYREKTGSIRS